MDRSPEQPQPASVRWAYLQRCVGAGLISAGAFLHSRPLGLVLLGAFLLLPALPARKGARWVPIAQNVLALCGVASVAAGCWMAWHPLGFIVGGLLVGGLGVVGALRERAEPAQ